MKVHLNRIIRTGQRRSQLVIAFVGSVIGLFLLIGSIQLYIDYNSVMFGGKDLLKDGFLINKKVDPMNTATGITAKFTEEEIEELEKSRFIEDVAPVLSTRFKIGFSLGDRMAGLKDFLFHYYAQAIPTRFLQTKDGEFAWAEGDTIVPMIVPTEFLSAFNNFAPSQGVPQLSEEALNDFHLNIVVEGNGHKHKLSGKIVGFTGKMNSTLLVPYEFLEWANGYYGDPNAVDEIQALFIQSNSKYHHEFIDLMEKNNYAVNESKLKASEEKSKLQVILSVVLFIGGIILVQAALNFILYSQLSIFKNEYEIGVLTMIGYDYKTISRTYLIHFMKIFIAISLTAFALAIVGKLWLNAWAQSRKIPLEGLLDPITYLVGIVFLVVYVLVNSYSISKSIKEIAKRN